jgi:hypothetical protein
LRIYQRLRNGDFINNINQVPAIFRMFFSGEKVVIGDIFARVLLREFWLELIIQNR